MITHQGRRTGKIRQTVLEVVRRDPASGEFIVVAGYGKNSDWYLNIQATTALGIHVWRRRFSPIQRFLTPEEVSKEFAGYERRHPRLAQTMARMIALEYDGSEQQRIALAAELPMIAFRPR